jgi:hypothetical protein
MPNGGMTYSRWFGPFLVEYHEKLCTCSYCKSCCGYKKMHLGLNIPTGWRDWNSWWVIRLPFRWYIRACVTGWFKGRPQ